MNFVQEQMYTFLAALGIGFIIGVILDAYLVYFQLVKVKKLVLCLVDFLLWVLLAVLTFALLLLCNWGDIRGYVFLGLALGLGLYLKYLNKPVLFFWYHFYQVCFRIKRRCVRVAAFPRQLSQKIVRVLKKVDRHR